MQTEQRSSEKLRVAQSRKKYVLHLNKMCFKRIHIAIDSHSGLIRSIRIIHNDNTRVQ